MFNVLLSDHRPVFAPLLNSVNQCQAAGVFSIGANGNALDGVTSISIEKETAPGTGVFVQTMIAALTADPQTFSGGVYAAVKYKARAIRNGVPSAYSAIIDLTGTVVSVGCATPINVSFIGGAFPQLQWDDNNFPGFTIAYFITDNLGGFFTGTVVGASVGHFNNLSAGATSATIFETFRCFTSASVTKP